MAESLNVHANGREASSTVVIETEVAGTAALASVHVKLKQPKAKKKVAWTEDTVDNEHMDKKKSKCCCIYEKNREFGESSSESEDECDHCKGHTEKKHGNPADPKQENEHQTESTETS